MNVPRRPRVLFLAAVLLTCAIYAPVLGFQFISDDLFYLAENHLIRSPLNVWSLIDVPADGVMGEMREGLLKGRNLRDVSYALDYWLWGLSPVGFHATNLVLHLLAGMMVYRLARRLIGAEAAPWVAAVFLLHPVHTEAVAYISGRKEPLTVILMLLVLEWVDLARRPRRGPLFWLAAFLFAAALFVKEAATVALPVLLVHDLLYARPTQRRAWARRVGEWLVLGAATGTVLGWRFTGHQSVPPVGAPEANALFLAAFYALREVLPCCFQFEYRSGFPPLWDGLRASRGLQGAVLAAVAALLFLLAKKRWRGELFGLALFWLALLPVLQLLFTFHTPASEHYLYVPGVGFALLAGGLLHRAIARWPSAGLAAAFLLLGGLALAAARRIPDYRNDYTLYQSAVAQSPRNPAAEYGKILGGARDGQTPLTEAIAAMDAHRARSPGTASFHYTAGRLYERAGQPRRARQAYLKAIELGRSPWEVYLDLARLEISVGDRTAAEQVLVELTRRYAYHPEAWVLLGALQLPRDPRAAHAAFTKAARADIKSDLARLARDVVAGAMAGGPVEVERVRELQATIFAAPRLPSSWEVLDRQRE